jgi:ArsR family transcriptional regulator
VPLSRNLQEEIHQLHAHLCGGLADPTRIMILYTLADGPHTVTEIVEALELPQPTVSRHLKVLRDTGLVTSRRDGQYVYYHLKDPRVIEALNLLRGILAANMQERAQLLNGTIINLDETGDETA